MKHSLRTGFSFGITSGIITTLGLIVGLESTTGSGLIVVGGILIIAIADSLSDAMGIHVSEESETIHSTKEIWESTISCFLSKFLFTLTFIFPVLLLQLSIAVIICVIWGFFLIILFSYYLAKKQDKKPYKIIIEHLVLATIIVIITHYVGDWIATLI
jgi:VIT1/CCC1 family predicted Fe2+/Mn2+ transporter